jgi:hypothetical protein
MARRSPSIEQRLESTLKLNGNWNLNDQLRSAPHGSQDILLGRQLDLLAHRARPFVPTYLQMVGVAWGVGRSLLDKLGSSARIRVPSVRGISARQEFSLKLTGQRNQKFVNLSLASAIPSLSTASTDYFS